jgi:hypothetical protein
MAPCCLAAATAAAVLTALIVAVLTAFVLATDGFGLGVLLSTALALALHHWQWIGPCPHLLYGFSLLLAVRAAWLLATTRRSLVLAVWRFVRPKTSWAVLHLTPVGWVQRVRSYCRPRTARAVGASAVYRIEPGP